MRRDTDPYGISAEGIPAGKELHSDSCSKYDIRFCSTSGSSLPARLLASQLAEHLRDFNCEEASGVFDQALQQCSSWLPGWMQVCKRDASDVVDGSQLQRHGKTTHVVRRASRRQILPRQAQRGWLQRCQTLP